jgi:hypothetical protein
MKKTAWVTHDRRQGGQRVEIETLEDITKLMRPGEDQIIIFTFSDLLNEYLKKIGEDPVDWEVILS